ncbi:MAG: CBS domain-containing protein [Endomicrobiia bacterium]|nr:CBS domain-containing protein [Endomicrobiia bacterium]
MLKAKDIMSTTITTIHPDETIYDAVNLLYNKKISGLPVVDSDGKLVGIITENDVLNLVFSGSARSTKVSDIMTKNVVTFSPDTDVDKISLTISEKKYRRVIITDENNKVVGIVSRHDIIRIILDKS